MLKVQLLRATHTCHEVPAESGEVIGNIWKQFTSLEEPDFLKQDCCCSSNGPQHARCGSDEKA